MTLQTILQDLEHFKGQTLSTTRNISPNPYSPVHTISNNHVAKPLVYEDPFGTNYFSIEQFNKEKYEISKVESFSISFSQLKQEAVLLQEAHDCGLAVPHPEGIFVVTLFDYSNLFLEKPINCPALVMEYLKETIRIDQIKEWAEREQALHKYGAELGKAKQLGFAPVDTGTHNALWNSLTKQAYIIDLRGWKRAQPTTQKK